MAKFFNLVKNEYIKLFNKVSTWIMLILLVIISVGFPLIVAISNSIFSYNYYGDETYKEFAQRQIEYAKQEKWGDWENEIARYEFAIEIEIQDHNDWRISNIDTLYFVDDEVLPKTANLDNIKTALKNDDWKEFYKAKIDEIKSYDGVTDEEKDDNSWMFSYLLENEISPYSGWKYDFVRSHNYNRSNLFYMEQELGKSSTIDMEEYYQTKEVVATEKYQLDNDIEVNLAEKDNYYNGFNFWTVLTLCTSLPTVVGILLMVVAGSIISSEFADGTIKFLLINPVKRGKILASKYFTVISLGYLMMAIMMVITTFTSFIAFSSSGTTGAYLYLSGDTVKEVSGMVYIIGQHLFTSISLIIYGTLAFAISSVIRSSALAIGISLGALLTGNIVSEVLVQLGIDWGRFLLFSNVNISAIMEGESLYFNHSTTFALTVLVVHLAVFLLTAWDGFVRREV